MKILFGSCALKINDGTEKLIRVAVIGDPNAGKSTLVNQILGRRINSVSQKVHTTRRKTLAVLNIENTQILFVDTPGFISRKSRIRHDLDDSLLFGAYSSLEDADLVVAVHDAGNFYTKYNMSNEIMKALRMVPNHAKTVLALNKVDVVTNKSELLRITKTLVQSPDSKPKRKSLEQLFDAYDYGDRCEENQDEKAVASPIRYDEVFMVSALNGVGVEALRNYMLAQAKPQPWLYDRGFITDQSMEELISLCVKEKMLNLLPQEIPYVVVPKVDLISEDENGQLNIMVSLPCTSRRHASALMGPSGSTIRDVALSAEQSLAEAFDKSVVLKLIIKQHKVKG